ncbi:hypothetical protein HDA30_000165 [Micrococcus cohnii]|uniref:Acyl-CoA carboxylase subunit epsilon n=1 Tax=Micrococcus cohnii TaxID=993416 RepID=A0A7W7M1Z0_9MICC|nr:hypothetical protein [Micrococcus cohnii]
MSPHDEHPDPPVEPSSDDGVGPDEAVGEVEEQLRISGAQLEPEEMAALTALLAQLPNTDEQAAAASPRERVSPRGPRGIDRTLERRRRLGLWARPGAGQWRDAAGPQ